MPSFIASLIIVIIFKNGNQQSVMANDGWGPWGTWVCTASCGGGGGRRLRQCIDRGPNKCPGLRYEFRRCNEQPCPVAPKPLSNKGWTQWMPWECPVTCGGGRGTRTRICEDPDFCEGPKEESGPCAQQPCPVDRDTVNEGLQRQIEQQMMTSRHTFVVQKGEAIQIPCKDRLAGMLDSENPNAKVTWVHNGKLVPLGGDRIKLDDRGDLKVTADLGDNGLWWCSVALTSKMSMTVSFAGVGVQNDKPDIEVEKGEPFEMKCMATSLSRLVKLNLDQKWIHNSSIFRELKDVKPENNEIFKISSSDYSNSGIWNCRYSVSSSSRQWVTSVYRVLVIPPKTFQQKLLRAILATVVSLVVIGVIARICWNRVKKKRLADDDEDTDDEESSEESDDDEPTPLFANRLNRYNRRGR